MVTVIKKGSSGKSVIKKIEETVKSPKKQDLRKYCGIISLKKDPVKLQKSWRNEWE